MEKLEKQAIELLQMMCGSTGCVISDSGGKDSSVLKHITLKAHEIYGLPFSVSAHSNRAAGRATADTASDSRRTSRRAGRERGCK